ncbi:MAG: YjzC family protein [Candidatus Didemnitutus sp.]|nr:YjzC family protein [Candidatus Didemnitutus sp.]
MIELAYIGQRYKTGDTCDSTGRYQWDGYTDGTFSPAPTAEENVIPLSKNETFPPVRSCNKGAYWKYLG